MSNHFFFITYGGSTSSFGICSSLTSSIIYYLSFYSIASLGLCWSCSPMSPTFFLVVSRQLKPLLHQIYGGSTSAFGISHKPSSLHLPSTIHPSIHPSIIDEPVQPSWSTHLVFKPIDSLSSWSAVGLPEFSQVAIQAALEGVSACKDFSLIQVGHSSISFHVIVNIGLVSIRMATLLLSGEHNARHQYIM